MLYPCLLSALGYLIKQTMSETMHYPHRNHFAATTYEDYTHLQCTLRNKSILVEIHSEKQEYSQ